MLYIIGIVFAFFLSFILFSKKHKSLADKFLMIWLLVTGTHIGFYYAYVHWGEIYPHMLCIGNPFPLLHGPFVLLYTIALTNPAYFKDYRWLGHFAIPLGMYLYLIPIFALSAEEKLVIIRNKGADFPIFAIVNFMLFIASGFVYVLWSHIVLQRHKKTIAQQFSNTERINLRWLQYLIYCLGISWLFVTWGNDDLIFGAASLFVLFIGYFGIKQVGIFTNLEALAPPQYLNQFEAVSNDFVENEIVEIVDSIDNTEVVKKKYQKSGLSDEQAEKLQKELAHIMQTEKLYKNPELTLADLAQYVSVHPNYLSQMLNEKEGVSFYDYVNILRIEEFKKQIALPENKNYTLLTVAYDCGFNSKSSFNRHFKKVMDVQPSEYVRGLN